jgi:tetratricopeptide (TPR) repeat protein
VNMHGKSLLSWKNISTVLWHICTGYWGKGVLNMNWLYSREIPIEAQFLYRKALDLEKLGNNETALRYFKQAVVIAPRYSKAIYEMGNCLAQLGQYDEARIKYDRARQIDPRTAEWWTPGLVKK